MGNALGRALLASGLVATDALTNCENRARLRNSSLPDELAQAGLLDSHAIADFVQEHFGFARVDAARLIKADVIPDLPASFYGDRRFLPLHKNNRLLMLAMADPTDEALLNLLRFQSGLVIDPLVADCRELATAVARLSGSGLGAEATSNDASDNPPETNPNNVDDAPAVRFLQRLLSQAVEQDASDIHFEPFEVSYRIRFRIDGILREAATPPADIRARLASRLKVLSRLNIAEKRLPQDGQMQISTDAGNIVDFRISTLPTLYGEKIVLRILDRQSARRTLAQLGLNATQHAQLLQAIHEPSGMILVTGPTGSGKTISLYACLNELNQPGVNIASAEDPVEIPVTGINQVNIDERTGLSFAVALRAFMRQDPDILMVGEIRDAETADIAVKAAQTGHLVLSTLHTRSAPASLERLRHLGVAPFNVAGSVLLIVAQRLVRKLCACKTPGGNDPVTLKAAGFNEADLAALAAGQWQPYAPAGCVQCQHSGYKGRLALFEVLPISPAIQALLIANASTTDIATQAKREGVIDLRRAGLEKVMAGDTALNDVLAATTPW